MTVRVTAGAASSGEVDWHGIDWAKAHQTTRRLQVRIAKAVREGRWGTVKSLQWLLTRSFSGKVIAVKRRERCRRDPGCRRRAGTVSRHRPSRHLR